MMKKYALIILVFCLMMISCKKNFDGITERDNLGNLISSDYTDWNFNDNWSNRESNLFESNFGNQCNTDTGNFSVIGYPNPNNGLFTLYFDLPTTYTYSFRIVDGSFKIIYSMDQLNSPNISCNLSNYKSQTVRVYYKIFGNNCELRGHGDLQIQ